MTKTTKFAATTVIAALLSAPALAMDSSFEAMSKSGKHRFYVWCTGKEDYVKSQNGANAKVAQASLAQEAGTNCWPVWQGKE